MALVAAILAATRPAAVAVAQTVPDGSEEVWSATVTVWDLVPGSVTGCDDLDSVRRFRCNSFNNLTDRTFRVGSTTYRVTGVTTGFNVLTVYTDPLVPTRLAGWSLVVTGHTQHGTQTYTASVTAQGRLSFAGVPTWQAGQSVELTLYRPYADIATEDVFKAASRSGDCGSDVATDDDNAANGRWHCHGDVYHRHLDWRARHPASHIATEDLRPTGDRFVPLLPRANTAAERSRGFTDGWHWHGDIYHSHGGGGGSGHRH